MDKLEQLKELKALLDSEVINQEEFDVLKHELLTSSDSFLKTEVIEEDDNKEEDSVIEKTGIFTISFDGQWFLIDAKTKIFVNGNLHSSHSTKNGFSVDLPIESDNLKLKVSIGGLKSTTYEISDLDISSNYHLRLTYDNTWGKYASNFNLEQNGKSIC